MHWSSRIGMRSSQRKQNKYHVIIGSQVFGHAELTSEIINPNSKKLKH